MNRSLPRHIAGTSRQWKTLKRREWRAVLAEYERFRLGVAYTPAVPLIDQIGRLFAEITERLSVAKWGR